MHDDDSTDAIDMDRLLKDTMAAETPQLSPGFDARVMRRVRKRRLTPVGRAVIAVYAVAATATAVWVMRDLQILSIAAGVVTSASVAAGASVYGRRLTAG